MSFTLHLGDCLDPVTGLASLADKSVDCTICDPPYEAEAHTKQRRTKDAKNGSGGGSGDGRLAGVYALDFEPITDETRALATAQIVRVTRRWILVFCQVEGLSKWISALEDAGANHKRPMVWIKPDAQPNLTGQMPGMGYEMIELAHPSGRTKWNGGGKCGRYEFNIRDQSERFHMTQKPVPLMESLVRDFTDPGELILDPFSGSGSTGVACIRNGRRFVGWEKNPKWHAAAVKRLEGTREQQALPLKMAKPKQETMIKESES